MTWWQSLAFYAFIGSFGQALHFTSTLWDVRPVSAPYANVAMHYLKAKRVQPIKAARNKVGHLWVFHFGNGNRAVSVAWLKSEWLPSQWS